MTNPLSKNLTRIDGDLLDMPNSGYFIAHQCNCLSPYVMGLAKAIYDKYPEADTRAGRKFPKMYGQFTISGPVLNMFTQFAPGKGNPGTVDSAENRLHVCKSTWTALLYTLNQENTKIAIPYGYGCGLAGGNWEADYYPMFTELAKEFNYMRFLIVKK